MFFGFTTGMHHIKLSYFIIDITNLYIWHVMNDNNSLKVWFNPTHRKQYKHVYYIVVDNYFMVWNYSQNLNMASCNELK